MTHAPFFVRERVAQDLPELADMVRRDQPSTGYPINFPDDLEGWIAANPVETAFVAVADGQICGHVAVRPAAGADDGDGQLLPLWAQAHGVPEEQCAAVSKLMVGADRHGTGVGAALLSAAVTWMLSHDRYPCLDVLPLEGPRSAVGFYERRGWTAVGEVRASWVRSEWPPLVAMIYPRT